MILSLLRGLLRPGPPAALPEPPREAPAEGVLQLRFLGTAGFALTGSSTTLVLDPYLSRAGVGALLWGRLQVDEALLARELPVADAVLVGHSHFDHVLDAPALCRRTGATLYGSASTAMVAAAAGLDPAQMRVLSPGEQVTHGAARFKPLHSRHGRVFGRVPLPGELTRPPPWPPRLRDLPHGAVWLWAVELGGLKVLHVDSADWIAESLAGVQADILCLCAVGRQYRQGYTHDLIRQVGAKVVVPCHWDDFTVPFGQRPRQIPGVDLDAFVKEIEAAGAEAVVLGVGGTRSFVAETLRASPSR